MISGSFFASRVVVEAAAAAAVALATMFTSTGQAVLYQSIPSGLEENIVIYYSYLVNIPNDKKNMR